VDVIISEWMGYFLLYENMIDSYICCISKFLKPNGITIPSEATIFLRAADIKMKNHQVQ
jgi:protein arginine N-methyltransferase 1